MKKKSEMKNTLNWINSRLKTQRKKVNKFEDSNFRTIHNEIKHREKKTKKRTQNEKLFELVPNFQNSLRNRIQQNTIHHVDITKLIKFSLDSTV